MRLRSENLNNSTLKIKPEIAKRVKAKNPNQINI